MRHLLFSSLLFCTCVSARPLGAQESASIEGPSFVKAGEKVTFTFNLDRAPNYPSNLEVSIQPKSGGGYGMSLEIGPGKTKYTLDFTMPRATPGGTWSVTVSFFSGAETLPLHGKPFAFEVIPDSSLIFPTSVSVGIAESQVQILRREALQLQAAIQNLKGLILESKNDPSLSDLLIKSLLNGQEALRRTENDFAQAVPSGSNDISAKIFFGDLNAQYDGALSELRAQPKRRATDAASFVPAALGSTVPPSPLYPAVAQGTLRALEHNELAYVVAADADSLTFDLVVESDPSDSEVSYRRHGEDFVKAPDLTRTTIKSLTFAVWEIRVEHKGLKPQTKEHDAVIERNHLLHFDLK